MYYGMSGNPDGLGDASVYGSGAAQSGAMRFSPDSFTSQVAASRAEAMLKAAPECAKSGLVVAPDYVTNTSRTIDNICVQPGTPRDNSNAPPPATDENKTNWLLYGGIGLAAVGGIFLFLKMRK